MTDLERLLAEALRESGESYEPSDQAEARRRFLERARRRRWYGFAQVAAVAGLGIGAFLFFTSQSGPETDVKPQPEQVAGAPEVVATIEIGGEPISIDSATGSEVWVTGGDRLVAIDPSTNEETQSLQLEDGPGDEVAVGEGHIWVSQTDGSISGIDPSTGDSLDEFEISHPEGSLVYFDLATDGDSLWAVDGLSDRVFTLGGPGSSQEIIIPGYTFSDVATSSEGDVWALDQEQGALVHVDVDTRETIGGPIEVPAGENADLIAGFQFVYLSPGNGTLYKISPPGTTDMIERDLGDSYMDLTVHEKSVWALVNVEDEHKQLFEINPATMEVIGEPLEIEGDANDVVAAAGSVWVADGRGEVLRIEPSHDADDAPLPAPDDSPTPTEDDVQESVENVVFVYSEDGDLFAETVDGTVQLTDTPEIEEDPALSPNGRYVVFERPDADGDDVTVEMDLKKRWECCFRGESTEPAVGGGGSPLGWVHPATDKKQAAIALGNLGSKGFQEFPVSPFEEPFTVRNLAFDHANQYLAMEAGYEGSALFVAPLTLNSNTFGFDMGSPESVSPPESEEGATYKGISAAQQLNVIKVCCGSTHVGGFTTAEFGEIDWVTSQYTKLLDITDLGLDLDSEELSTSYLGGYVPQVNGDEIEWSEGRGETWLVGDGTDLWVIGEGIEATQLPMTAEGGAAAPNDYAINPYAGAD